MHKNFCILQRTMTTLVDQCVNTEMTGKEYESQLRRMMFGEEWDSDDDNVVPEYVAPKDEIPIGVVAAGEKI